MATYLDNAATSFPKPESVYGAVDAALRRGGSPNRGMYGEGLEATRGLFEIREVVADFIGAPDSSRVVFGFNATDCLNLALKGWVRDGDHVVTSDIEHNAVVRPLHAMAERRGVRMTRIAADECGRISPDDVLDAVSHDTRLVVLTHSSNVLGAVNPVEEIGRRLAERRIPLLVDAAQTVGYVPVDVRRMGLAMLAAPGHKSLLGPQGTGFLWVHEELELHSWREGGTGTESRSQAMPDAMPEALEAGTHNYPGLAGLAAGIAWLQDRGLQSVSRHKQELVAAAVERIRSHPSLRIVSAVDPADRSPLVTFTHDGIDSERIASALSQRGVSVRAGLHCAPGAHEKAGSDRWGAVRVSPGAFNTMADIDAFGDALGEVMKEIA